MVGKISIVTIITNEKPTKNIKILTNETLMII
jgi:hypothetical protein